MATLINFLRFCMLQPFLSFGLAFSSDKAHNMFTAMFDPMYSVGWVLVNIPVILTLILALCHSMALNAYGLLRQGFPHVSFLYVFCTCAMAKKLLSSKKQMVIDIYCYFNLTCVSNENEVM
jgi:hypothetical protein